MLVLSRKESDEIVFPSLGITIQVLSSKGSQVRLGIDAPDHIKILRGELADDGFVSPVQHESAFQHEPEMWVGASCPI